MGHETNRNGMQWPAGGTEHEQEWCAKGRSGGGWASYKCNEFWMNPLFMHIFELRSDNCRRLEKNIYTTSRIFVKHACIHQKGLLLFGCSKLAGAKWQIHGERLTPTHTHNHKQAQPPQELAMPCLPNCWSNTYTSYHPCKAVQCVAV